MYTKYITDSNWSPLSGVYVEDSTVNLGSEIFVGDGKLSVAYIPFFSETKDYTNNNYSMFFLSKESKLNSLLELDTPKINQNTKPCLIACNYINKLVSEDTLFFSLTSNNINLKNIKVFNNTFFIELYVIDSSNIIIYTLQDNKFILLVVDPLDGILKTVNIDKHPRDITGYEKEKYSLNYIYDKNTKNIVFYKNLNNTNIIFVKTSSNALSGVTGNPDIISDNNIFTVMDVLELPKLTPSVDFVSYKTVLGQNNIFINKEKSNYSIKNNYLGHIEYNNIKNNTVPINILTLKNQLNVTDNQNRAENLDNSFRSYVTIQGGGKRESGYSNLNLNYIANKSTYTFFSDKTTWFHVPFTKNVKPTNINNTSFFTNGAIAGNSPLYSDKIWKKLGNYSNNSEFRAGTNIENTGQWLCSWLSGGPDNAIWVDRFYNNETFTALDALKYSSNVNYTPQTKNLYVEGINDYPSKLLIEPGSWYAYNHIGKNTATSVLSSIRNFLITEGLDVYKNSSESDEEIIYDTEGLPIYTFNGNRYGKIYNVKNKSEYNNFTLSFFASRKDWNIENSYNILGNYIDTGFSIINNNKINVLGHFFTDTILYFYNDNYENILTIDLTELLYSRYEDVYNLDKIKGVVYRSLVDNFYIITDFGYIFEYSANGTLTDSLTTIKFLNGEKVLSYSYNTNYMVFLDNYNSVYRLNFKDNSIIKIPDNDIQNINDPIADVIPTENYSLLINFADKIFRVYGKSPILKNNRLYFKDIDNKKIHTIDVSNLDKDVYIEKNKEIQYFNFNNNDETILLYSDGHEVYDIKGNFLKEYKLSTNITGLSSTCFSYLNFGNEYKEVVQGISKNNILYSYDFNYNKFTKLQEEFYTKKEYNITFDNYYQSVLNSLYPIPTYSIKVKLNNIINIEDYIVLTTNIPGLTLDTGTHHIAVVLDTLNGFLKIYVDGSIYDEHTFMKGKYSFNDRIKEENIIVGTTPFYGGLTYNNFYKSNNKRLYVDDFVIEKFKYYSKALSTDEIRMEFLSKTGTSNINIDIEVGERNYMDTISKVFKHKTPGSKSNLINIYINDSLVKDKTLQDAYNNMILKEIYDYLPGYVKVNKILWSDNKKNTEQMLESFFNTENTLTQS